MAENLTITSPDFDPDGPIPDRLARSHEEQTPTLQVSGVPEGTVELAVVCHDPDAPKPRGWVHWAVYGLPPGTTTLDAQNVDRFRVGPNDWQENAWGGPQPPPGHGVHRYYFWVYALSAPVEGTPTYAEFLDRHGSDVIAQNRVVGTYETA
jgi:Raf kinase inhibitor-like YbhB/YbcL family protein